MADPLSSELGEDGYDNGFVVDTSIAIGLTVGDLNDATLRCEISYPTEDNPVVAAE